MINGEKYVSVTYETVFIEAVTVVLAGVLQYNSICTSSRCVSSSETSTSNSCSFRLKKVNNIIFCAQWGEAWWRLPEVR